MAIIVFIVDCTRSSTVEPTASSICAAGSAVSPLLHLATVIAAGWAVRPVLGSRGQTLTMLALLVQPGLLVVSAAGRADHHTLQVLLLVVGIGLTLRALVRPEDRRWAYAAGAVAAGGIWVGAEQVIAAPG